ncbi:MAG: hypothetical protein K5867_05340 [Bacteroidales bacterium]|nr:hypothetical protein [Bacteroidales bacterium]
MLEIQVRQRYHHKSDNQQRFTYNAIDSSALNKQYSDNIEHYKYVYGNCKTYKKI